MILRIILAVAFGFIILVSACQTIEGSTTSIPTLRAIPNIAPPTRTPPILVPIAASEWTLPALSAKLIAAPETMQYEWTEQYSYEGSCYPPPSGWICVQYSDDYIWLVQDSIYAWASEGTTIEIAQGYLADYYHMLGTLYVRTVFK
jgi:hypothetical protein